MQKATHLVNIRYDVTEGEESSAEVKRQVPWSCLRVSTDDAREGFPGRPRRQNDKSKAEAGGGEPRWQASVAGRTATIAITVTTALAYCCTNHDPNCLPLCVTFLLALLAVEDTMQCITNLQSKKS